MIFRLLSLEQESLGPTYLCEFIRNVLCAGSLSRVLHVYERDLCLSSVTSDVVLSRLTEVAQREGKEEAQVTKKISLSGEKHLSLT